MSEPVPAGFSIASVASATDVDAVLPLWETLYRHEAASGMAYALRPDAAAIWRDEAVRRIGTPNYQLLIARAETGTISGFLACSIRRRPAIYAEPLVGTVVEIFVAESARGHGLGRALLAAGEAWFRSRGVNRIEVQTVAGNTQGRSLYEHAGWTLEIVQYRRDIPKNP